MLRERATNCATRPLLRFQTLFKTIFINIIILFMFQSLQIRIHSCTCKLTIESHYFLFEQKIHWYVAGSCLKLFYIYILYSFAPSIR
ncbi:hypothetical protein METBIDRAFT_147884 [Metschnikowia bicuspidata var. bicuspidata NRRL YB-4993]|uniref:Uncharacterized protein n=1 Tax=Metschnikowia bicuspidata var. bicuspidata NRRL YB-4993 TaxID=869754 RepID=A0A1A0HE45_9ASCO|nr:hypothetical protein METBIDRAFT_147884 [Metschnikowia bicuspidata var. bicuspidata NRRL YB-4993]OBA22172.1 hypothetical protein METBIDRAFT_147884 [Metschnikowia bicuspidata var. bicuspidata NRRL YB-4993]